MSELPATPVPEAEIPADPWHGIPRFPVERLTAFAESVLIALGLSEDQAGRATRILILADLRGIESHGLGRLRFYADRLREGKISLGAPVTTVRESAATLALDANNGLGLLQAATAMERCIAKAEETGLCLTTVRGCNHFGIAGAYALMAARRGLCGVSMTNAGPLVVPLFGAHAMLGTNPLAVAVPTGPNDEPPLVLDMSTSAVSWGKIEIAQRAGTPIPLGWALDEESRPTTDPWAARWLVPLGGDREVGGQKGYGLGVIVDILCGPLAGAAWSAQVASFRALDRSANLGHTFMAWRIDAFRDPADFYADLATMMTDLRATPVAPGHEGKHVIIPGDPEIAAEAANRASGIPLRLALIDELATLAASVGVPFDLGGEMVE